MSDLENGLLAIASKEWEVEELETFGRESIATGSKFRCLLNKSNEIYGVYLQIDADKDFFPLLITVDTPPHINLSDGWIIIEWQDKLLMKFNLEGETSIFNFEFLVESISTEDGHIHTRIGDGNGGHHARGSGTGRP